MIIDDTFQIEDQVSGLRVKVVPGKKLDRLHIGHMPTSQDHPDTPNSDFWFTKDGEFDGTGSSCNEQDKI